MALSIVLDPLDTGLAPSYWRITQAHIDHAAGQVTLWLHGWRDAAAREKARAAGGSLTFVLHAADFVEGDLHALTTARLYEALKARAAAAAASAGHALGSLDHAILAAAADC